MTADLETVLADYRTGLDAELALLSQLETVARSQRALAHPTGPEQLSALAHARNQHLRTFAALEQEIQPLRQRIAGDLPASRRLPGFAAVVERHRLASELVARIMQLDEESLAALQQADVDRRADAHTLETGEATLAAYRRILQQPLPSAGLFTQRG